ncbi:MAG: putative quinol monooxygenase [Burkholderiales bacterium]
MYVITVEFTVRPEAFDAFLPLMLVNARLSRETEAGCRQFDVCTDPGRPGVVFLYELYDDRAAFDAHRATPHFRSFDAAVKEMLTAKVVHAWTRRAPA